MATAPVLHLYAQAQNHDEAYVVGTPEGLKALRSALDAAIASGQGDADVLAADGEGYRLTIISKPNMDEMQPLQYPYTDQIGRDGTINTWLVGGDIHPSHLVK